MSRYILNILLCTTVVLLLSVTGIEFLIQLSARSILTQDQITTSYIFANTLKIIGYILSGYIFDKYGFSKTTITSSILIIIASACLALQKSHYIIISLLAISLSKAFLWGKIESYIYNLSALSGKTKKFGRSMSFIYIVLDIFMGLNMYLYRDVTNQSYNNLNFISIIAISQIIMCIVAIFITLKMDHMLPKNDSINNIKSYCINIKNIALGNRNMFWLICIMSSSYGFLNFGLHEMPTLISQDLELGNSRIMFTSAINMMTMGIGSLLTVIVSYKYLIGKKIAYFSIIISLFSIITWLGLFYNHSAAFCFLLTILLLTNIELGFMYDIDSLSKISYRGSISSIIYLFANFNELVISLLIKIQLSFFKLPLNIAIILSTSVILFFIVKSYKICILNK
jgi:MFS family permease